MLAYSIKDAAEQLGVCERLMRELVREKRVRSVKIGRRVIIPKIELDRLLAPPQAMEMGEVVGLVTSQS